MVTLVKQDYDENKKKYNQTREMLISKLDNSVSIEHVGSTAIPDMWGKNIVDILIGVDTLDEFNKSVIKLRDLGYYESIKSKTNVYQFFASKKEETSSGDTHIHLAIKNTDRYNEFIWLRDYLLSNTNEAKKYSEFKRELLRKNISDRGEYREIKSKYVSDLIERAKIYFKVNESINNM